MYNEDVAPYFFMQKRRKRNWLNPKLLAENIWRIIVCM